MLADRKREDFNHSPQMSGLTTDIRKAKVKFAQEDFVAILLKHALPQLQSTGVRKRSFGRWCKSEHCFLQLDRSADQFTKKALINFGAPFIFGAITFVVTLGKDSDSHRIQAIDRVGKRLKNGKAVF